MDIKGLGHAEVLAALYNNSRQQGMGFLNQRGAGGMTVEQAEQELANNDGVFEFDYLHGRVMKVHLDGDDLETRLYDRDNGVGAAERALAPLLAARSTA